jgi:hypothetical protein
MDGPCDLALSPFPLEEEGTSGRFEVFQALTRAGSIDEMPRSP